MNNSVKLKLSVAEHGEPYGKFARHLATGVSDPAYIPISCLLTAREKGGSLGPLGP